MSNGKLHSVADADQRLVRHLVVAVLLKLLVLTLLWQYFVREQHVKVDGQRMAEIVTPATAHPAQDSQEAPHDQ